MGWKGIVRRASVSASSFALAGAAIAGCGRTSMPDPRDTVRAYEAAAAKGDARAIHGMLSERSRKSLG